MKNRYLATTLFAMTILLMQSQAKAELEMSAVFGNSMVLQRDMPIHIWGWTKPNQKVTAELAGHTGSATADAEGRFDVALDPLSAGGPHELVVVADEKKTFTDVLVGEVWLCSGQSNMQWTVDSANDPDLEKLTANFPNIRLITVPQVGTQEPQRSFVGNWEACSPASVGQFSAVGFFFGRQLHQTLNVPIGLIDNAWGGSAAEAWVRRDRLEADQQYADLLAKWDDLAKSFDMAAATAKYEEQLAKWKETKQGPQPRKPGNELAGQHRPSNLYNGVLLPVMGYTIRGAIWYQGESNSARAYQYRDLFPLMIQSWRDEWKQGDFPFYWVQLADYLSEVDEPAESAWAELREAQTMTMSKLPNTGEAVILNLGEASDIHPKNKQDVARRLARWALAKDYGINVPYHSPTYESMVVTTNGRVNIDFDHVSDKIDTFDVPQPIGFAIAGEDRKFVWAEAKIVDKDTIQVWNDKIKNPVAVRYAWGDNPVCNVQSAGGLPLTPFRTDDWPGVTVNVTK